VRGRRPALHDHDNEQSGRARDRLRGRARPCDVYQTGKFIAVPLDDPSLPTYTGSLTGWGGFNQNSDSVVNGTLTFSVRGKGSDGSRFTNSNVEHFNTRPDGSVNELFRCH
jgi:hypothetical protein